MIHLLTLFTVVTVSAIIVRVGALALQKTGLSRDSAIFQAQSAFMQVGFTTAESESVVTHPVRRRIIGVMMLLGFIGVTSFLGAMVVTLASAREPGSTSGEKRLLILIGGLFVMWLGWRLRPIERLLDGVISRALERMTDLRIVDYEEIMKLNKGYTVAVLPVDSDCWMAGSSLRELELVNEGVLVLSVTREDGTVLGTPASTTELIVGDKILCYGLQEDLTRLSQRECGEAGDRDHMLAIRRQRLRLVEEKVEDQSREVDAPVHSAEG